MKKIIIGAIVLLVVTFGIMVAIAGPDSPLYGVKSLFMGGGAGEQTKLNGSLDLLENELIMIDSMGQMTPEQANESKGRVIALLIDLNTELNAIRGQGDLNDAVKTELKSALYRLNDLFADHYDAITRVDTTLGAGPEGSDLFTLMAQTQIVFKNFVVKATGTGIILREAVSKSDKDKAKGVIVDDVTGRAVIFTSTGSEEEQPVE